MKSNPDARPCARCGYSRAHRFHLPGGHTYDPIDPPVKVEP